MNNIFDQLGVSDSLMNISGGSTRLQDCIKSFFSSIFLNSTSIIFSLSGSSAHSVGAWLPEIIRSLPRDKAMSSSTQSSNDTNLFFQRRLNYAFIFFLFNSLMLKYFTEKKVVNAQKNIYWLNVIFQEKEILQNLY